MVGKEATATGGVSNMNKAANTAYTPLNKEEKQKLLMRSRESEPTHTLSENEIVSAGGKIVKKLQTQVHVHHILTVTETVGYSKLGTTL